MNEVHVKHTTCPSCFSKSFYTIKGNWINSLVKCSSCSLVFHDNKPTKSEIEEIYSEYSYFQHEEMSDAIEESYNKLLKMFDSFRINNRILDLGCGRGWFLEVAQKRGWKVTGVEMSEKAVEICLAKGLNVIHSEFKSELFVKQEFDVVYCSEVLEHVNNSNEFVSDIIKVIRKSGALFITTPNFNSILRYYLKEKFSIVVYPEHLCYFTPFSLHQLLSRCGYRKSKLFTSGISLSRSFDGLESNSSKVKKLNDSDVLNTVQKYYILKIIKRAVNFILNITGGGSTIKALYIKG